VGLRELFAAYPQARFHWYGKAESKVGRKMGHLNLPVDKAATAIDVLPLLRGARDVFYRGWTKG
jgi:phosphoribosylaminoimidazole carboxylase (NCAIR synthetase)